jgi:hypothetical protein
MNASPYVTRLAAIVFISVAVVAIVNEGGYLLQKEKTDRPPKTIQLLIPAGTAERMAAGEAGPAIPDRMVFVMGDVLEVKNEDSMAHQLGPIWVPPGTTGRLDLLEANKFTYSCSFAKSRFLGLDVRPPTTLGTRIAGMAIAAPPTVAILFLYSLVAFPVKTDKKRVSEPV